VVLTVAPTSAAVTELLAHWRVGAVVAPLNSRLSKHERKAAEEALVGAHPPPGTQALLWTSGTSGRPRGVALSWANLEHSVRAAAARLELAADDVWLAALSPAHVGGLVLVVRSVLLGSALLIPDALDTAAISDCLDGVGLPPGAPAPTHVSLVPTQLAKLLDHRGSRPAPSSLRCVLVGGAHAPASLVARAHDAGWPVALTYGSTEMTSQIATAPPALTLAKPGTVGPPLDGVEVRVEDDGSLLVRGPTGALGYVGEDEDMEPLASPDGWYRTGDLGRIDDEGHLWITGRRIDRIVSGGVTLDAVEVEEALRAHPTVIDACVVGLADDTWGQRVAAWVEPVEGEFEQGEIERFVAERLSSAKRPRAWHVAHGLPRNVNGKVDRQRVLEIIQGRRG